MEFTREEYIRGIELCIKNSDELIQEAQILWLLRRPRAYALYQLAIEEIGKAMLILTLLIDEKFSFTSEKEFNKLFTSHQEKNELSQILDLFILAVLKTTGKGSPSSEEILRNFATDDVNNWYDKLNLNKNQSLYVSTNKVQFHAPSDVITAEMVEEISAKALIRNKIFKSVTKNGIEHLLESQVPGLLHTEEHKEFREAFNTITKDIYNVSK
jgi:AbiV family abortive infection protein